MLKRTLPFLILIIFMYSIDNLDASEDKIGVNVSSSELRSVSDTIPPIDRVFRVGKNMEHSYMSMIRLDSLPAGDSIRHEESLKLNEPFRFKSSTKSKTD